MKKLLIVILIVAGVTTYSNAQVNPHAIGLRFGGDGHINGAEVSYQHGFSERNRLELDFGVGGNKNEIRTTLVGMYHWDWNIVAGFNWFVGPGAGIGIYTQDDLDTWVNIALGGQIGVEYDFNHLNVPILVSVDARPMWDFLGDPGFGWGACLGVRYTW